jgi:branched-chain amino acid transport system permease protein
MGLPLYYYLSITAFNILMSWALYLPYRIGQLHFLTVAAMAISGYTAAYLVLAYHIPFAAALFAGFLLGGLLGWLVSRFMGDAPTFSVVIAGFAFIFLTRTVVENLKALGGTLGVFGLPDIGGSPAVHRAVILCTLLGLLLLVGLLIRRFDHGRLGRAASTVFTDRELAASVGADVKPLGRLLQTAGCTLAGGCGVLYCFIYTSFNLDFFAFSLIGTFVTVLFVGGCTTQWGPVIAAPLLYGLPLLLPMEAASWKIVFYGVLLILILTLKPEGLVTRRGIYGIERALSGLGKNKEER